MKVKSLKNFFLFDSRKISIDEVIELENSIALDLIKGNFVIEHKEKIIKKKSKVGDE